MMIIIVFPKFFKRQLLNTAVNQPPDELQGDFKKVHQEKFLALLHQHSLSLLAEKLGNILPIKDDMSTKVGKKEKAPSAYKPEV